MHGNAGPNYSRPQFQLETNNLTKAGDRTARELAALCGSAFARLACIAAGITGQSDLAEDIVQQAIAIAIEKDSTFESSEHYVAWLAGIVRNCALNHRRKTHRRKTHSTDPTILTQIETRSAKDEPIDRVTGDIKPFQCSFDDKVNAALQRLSPEARSCLLLRTIEQLSYREISTLMSIPEGTAMSLVHRSKKTLRDVLAADKSLAHDPSVGGDCDE
jgi:RNA polymerase sigma-70 factor (ECF subfamily)